ncbi:CobW family GTP-binding protein [Microbacterium halophytorum]|uniref:CobW family GTP-binding protein n=1 Tax=Microbacterium halophytorum TaxID=2067568 RepID=UPI000CFDEE86|nr:GTP-binding protein [Microbacterium halophytorum]
MTVPVIALTGPLGAGKTTVLNHLLAAPGARIGVVVNDFGAINVDAGLVVGQVDEAASIAGGCVCCMPDAGGLDEALAALTDPKLRLDAVIVEASGVAEPVALARLIRFSGADNARLGGVIDVIDAVEYEESVAAGLVAPARYAAATLAVVNKTDIVPERERDARVAALAAAVREHNPGVEVVPAARGAIDPGLVFDVDGEDDPVDQLPIAQLLREQAAASAHDHAHAESVGTTAAAPVAAGALVDLLESPPEGAYRMKGTVPVRTARGSRAYTVHRVGRSVHVERAPRGRSADGLVAIGTRLAVDAAERIADALRPAETADADGLRRLERYERLSH